FGAGVPEDELPEFVAAIADEPLSTILHPLIEGEAEGVYALRSCDAMPDGRWRETDYYRSHCLPAGLDAWLAAVTLLPQPGRALVVLMHRSSDAEPFTHEDQRLAEFAMRELVSEQAP